MSVLPSQSLFFSLLLRRYNVRLTGLGLTTSTISPTTTRNCSQSLRIAKAKRISLAATTIKPI